MNIENFENFYVLYRGNNIYKISDDKLSLELKAVDKNKELKMTVFKVIKLVDFGQECWEDGKNNCDDCCGEGLR